MAILWEGILLPMRRMLGFRTGEASSLTKTIPAAETESYKDTILTNTGPVDLESTPGLSILKVPEVVFVLYAPGRGGITYPT